MSTISEEKAMLSLSEKEKMRAAAEIHLSRGKELLAAAGGPDNSSFLGSGASLEEQRAMAVARANTLLDGPLGDRPFMGGMRSGMGMGGLSGGMSGLGMGGMGMGGMGMGMGSMGMGMGGMGSMYGGDMDYLPGDQLKMERMMMMRRREMIFMAEERARLEAMQLRMKMRAASTSIVTPGSALDSESTLAALGNSMRKKSSPYIDASAMADPPEFELARRRTRGGVTEPFPEKLHRMLLEIEKDGMGHIISFFPHGRAFGIHDTEKFEEKIMPKYFKQSRLSSFQRQLNLYGFTRIVSGPDASGYYHELFLKGRPALCTHMRRVGIPKGVDRRKVKSAVINKKEPDFYSMRPSI